MNKKKAVAQWYLYIIETKLATLYCGITTDVDRRFDEHNSQGAKCAKYLRGKAPLKLLFSHALPDRATASTLEYHVKRLTKKQKLAIIAGKLDLLELLVD